MQAKVNGISLNYRIDGPVDAPWLVFSNSLATDLSMWDEQASYFGATYRVLRYDQRGHGHSQAPEGRYNFDTLIDDAVGLMDALSIEHAQFCGLSMGGATAMALVQRYPERIERAVICDSPCAATAASAQQWEERIIIAQEQGMAALVDSTIARWFPAETVQAKPPHLTKIRDIILATSVNGFIGCAAALANHDFRSSLHTVTRPILLIVGEKDGSMPVAMQQMQSQLPDSRLVVLPGAGHISNLDRPDVFNQTIESFLRI